MEALLQLALALLIAAQQPNVPAELRMQAVALGNYAISVAAELKPTESVLLVATEPSDIPAAPIVSEYERALQEIAAERAALIVERATLYRKAEAMGGSRDTIAGYKRFLTADINAKLEALNEREATLNAQHSI